MMGDIKPNFALDLSNEGVSIWHRDSDGGWSSLGTVPLTTPDFKEQLEALRESVPTATGRMRRAVIRIPRSEVLLAKVRLGVFEGEAAVRHAHKQIAELSPYEMHEISFDLGDRGFGNIAPVGIVARQTLIEAEAFAKDNGFEPHYFTTQYAEKEFDREPRFQIAALKPAAKPLWFVPWVAAASIGLAVGYFGYSYLSTSDQPTDLAAVETEAKPVTEVASVEPTTQTEPEATVTAPAVDTATLGLQDVAPALPPVTAILDAPNVSQYPDLQIASLNPTSEVTDPATTRLQAVQSDDPQVSVSSKQLKTADLQIAEARRDLPEVSVNDEIVAIIQSEMTVLGLNTPEPAETITLAALTAPDQTFAPALLSRLPLSPTSETTLNDTTLQPADRPAPPPSLVTAEPGTLTPTAEGTLGPDNILIFAGRPPVPPRNRVDPEPPELALAGFRPRLRPNTLNVPADLLAAVEPEAVAEPSILDLADPTLRPLRARIRPDTLVVPETQVIAATEDPETPVAEEEPSILALADPTLRGARALLRPDGLSERAETLIEAQTLSTLGDPNLRPFRARLRPESLASVVAFVTAATNPDVVDPDATPTATETTDLAALVETAIADSTPDSPAETTDEIANAIAQDTLVQAIQEDASLLALADPSLSGLRARARPSTLRVITPEEQQTLLALADPTLAGKRTRVRPRNLRIIKPEPEPEVETPNVEALIEQAETEAEAEQPAVIRGTKQAVAVSPKPKVRPRKLARVVERVTREAARTSTTTRNDGQSGVSTSGGSTRATARLPKSARGSVKSAPPTTATVARAATEKSRFKKSRMNLVGIFGAPNKRRALIRLPTGRYVKVQTGDKVSGWQVSAIGESSLRIKRGSRNQTLRIP